MRGQILGVETTRGVGVLVGADGARLEFPLSEWRSASAPAAGQTVDFVLENGQAKQVYGLPAAAAPAPIGAAPGRQGSTLGGIAVGCLALGFLIPVLPVIAAFVLGLIGAQRSREEGDESGLVLSRVGWIGSIVYFALGIIITLSALLFLGAALSLLGAWGVTLPGIIT
jgi:hypothetical protein